jgi:hypothetical protein
MNSHSERDISDVLAAAGMGGAVRLPMTGDASTRSYERLQRQGRRAILMKAPPGAETPACPPEADAAERARLGYNAEARLAANRVDAFVTVASRLRALGLSAPDVYAANPETGLAVIEDFGEQQYHAVLERGVGDATTYYAAAVDALVRLHEFPAPARLEAQGVAWPLLSYDLVAMHAETRLLPEHFARQQLARPVEAAAFEAWRAAWEAAFAPLVEARRVLTMRDFHSPNLMWLSDRVGPLRVGVLDFQDALAGHPAYDLASLLEDARRTVAPEFAAAMLDRYINEAAIIDDEGFRAAFAVLAAQRNAKIIGIFARLKYRDGKPLYVARHQPRVISYFRRDLSHPALRPVAEWIAQHLPFDLWGAGGEGAEGAAA